MLSKARPRTGRSDVRRAPAGRQRAAPAPASTYWTLSTRPLHVLLFLLPLIVFYEIGSAVYLVDLATGTRRSVVAKSLLEDFFNVFGVAGAFMPGIALAVVLLVWHLMSRDRWRVDPGTLAAMLFESAAWALPLLVLNAVVNQLVHAPATAAHAHLALAAADLQHQSTATKIVISIGAGLYEEMLFRLVGLALLHYVLVDLIGMPQRWGAAGAVGLSALAFAAYHGPSLPADWGKVVFYVASGVYLGTVYIMRGFGIAAAAHAIFDVLVLVVLDPR